MRRDSSVVLKQCLFSRSFAAEHATTVCIHRQHSDAILVITANESMHADASGKVEKHDVTKFFLDFLVPTQNA